MEPRHPFFSGDSASEEPIEVPDYYEAMRLEWLGEDIREEPAQAATSAGSPKEQSSGILTGSIRVSARNLNLPGRTPE